MVLHLLEELRVRIANSIVLFLELELSFEAGSDLILRGNQLALQPLYHLVVVLTLLFLGPVTGNQGLGQHLNFLNHRLLLKPLQVVLALDEVGLVLGSDF